MKQMRDYRLSTARKSRYKQFHGTLQNYRTGTNQQPMGEKEKCIDSVLAQLLPFILRVGYKAGYSLDPF